MLDTLQKLHKAKVAILAIVTTVLGIGLLFLARWAETAPEASWLTYWPIFELGSTLFITGALVVAYTYIDGQDKERLDEERLKRVLERSAPAIRDAVVRGFAVESDDLARVATPELLDQIATNVLALRLGNRAFAEEVYNDVRDQAIKATERWHDVQIFVRLSEDKDAPQGAIPRFIVTVRWEYSVVPSHAIQRFACISNRAEFGELIDDIPATSTWFMTPRPGFDASDRDAFELLQYSFDGVERAIRRSAHKTGQTYSVDIGEDLVRLQKPVRISYTYKTITAQHGHLLHFDIDQPTQNIAVELDYSDSGISHVSVLDLIASSRKPRIQRAPISVPGKTISVNFEGWIFPRTGFAFVWTLNAEQEIFAKQPRKPNSQEP